ncbi:MAG TPA: UbiD family decarboxylase [Phycisphaerae bacterium]|nr:UbiD family decarboxylase [Phycisphaerae bacterium]HRW53183.1 UbiD family decarboxylase [Phycisphaerae bacterium]
MPYPDLRSFVDALDSSGQLKRVSAQVNPELEITEIADRVSKSPCPEGSSGAPDTDPIHGATGGHALLFENVLDSDIPVAINLFGSYARMRMALGCEDFESLAARVEKLAKPQPPTSLMEKMKMLPELAKIAGYAPKRVKRGACQEVVHTDKADLFNLPIIKCWPHDAGADDDVMEGIAPASPSERHRQVIGGPNDRPAVTVSDSPVGRYITLAGIYTTAPDGSEPNIGMYRIQATGPKSALFHCHMHHDGARHQRMWAAQGREMPVAIALGGESVLPYAATCPLPPSVSELLFAGFLNDGGIPLCPGVSVPIDVPANAEIVIEGFVSPWHKEREGPFGDHTGFYSLADNFPSIRVTAITHRRNPIYPTTIVGLPPMEDYYMGKATERVFLPLLKMLIPDVVDYHLPRWGAFHNFAFVRIRKEYPYQARRVASAVWGAGQMAFTKFIVIVDEDVNVHDEQEVMFHVGANVDPRRDTFVVEGPLDILDHAAPYCGAGSKMGIDATRKIQGEGVVRPWPKLLKMNEEIVRLVDGRWREYGLD